MLDMESVRVRFMVQIALVNESLVWGCRERDGYRRGGGRRQDAESRCVASKSGESRIESAAATKRATNVSGV